METADLRFQRQPTGKVVEAAKILKKTTSFFLQLSFTQLKIGK